MEPKLVSFLIPARNEIYLEKTVRNILANIRGDSEVLVGLDGYLPDPQINIGDDRVIFYHFKDAVGHRAVTNELARHAKGKFICKIDAHCAIGEGFDVIMAEDCKYDETHIARMYNLDIETWKPKLIDDFNKAVRHGKLHDYLYLGMNEKNELRSFYYPHGINKPMHHERKDILVDETLSCMGPSFFMYKDRFWELDGCDENHGIWGAQSVEVSLKAWLSGGKLMTNKKTWFAHWFRADQGWPYPISGKQVNRARSYSTDLWLNNKWPKQVRPLSWLIEKFWPVPDWTEDDLKKIKIAGEQFMNSPISISKNLFEVKPNCIHKFIRNMFNLRAQGHPSPIAARKGDRNTLVELWKKVGYKEGVEIGVSRGEFSETILKTGMKLHCVDPWDTYPDSRLSVEKQKENYGITLNRLKTYLDSGKCIIHKEYSEDASKKFKDGSLDFIFIDGMHTFDGCVLDLIKWVPKVRKGGMVALHDYCPMNRNGVIKAVDAYTYCHQIHPWFVTREIINTAFWVVE